MCMVKLSDHIGSMDLHVSSRERVWSSHRIICNVQAVSKWLPSMNCIQAYVMINGPLVTFGCILHLSLRWAVRVSSPSNPMLSILLQVIIFGMKNFLLLLGIDSMTSSRPDIVVRDKQYEADKEVAAHSSWRTVISSVATFTILETATYTIAKTLGLIQYSSSVENVLSADFIIGRFTFFGTFIIVSFAIEIMFDFFHYWTHRFLHLQPALYKSLHSLHHHNSNPTVYHTFNDTICGTIVTNTIPHLLALFLFSILFFRPIHHSEHSLLLVYKTFVEISGHSGKELGKASSFPQWKWLPVFFGIELYTCDHHSHHRNPKTNFSKRFVLWDKIFLTHLSHKKSQKEKR